MIPGETPVRNYKWLVVGMLWFVCFFNYADRQAIFGVFPLIKQQLGLTDVQLGVVGAAFMWMYALFGPLAGWLCDRLPRKNLVLGGLIAWSLVTALTALCHTYGQLVLCRALSGLGEAVYLPAAMSLIGDYHSAATRSRAMSLHQSSVYVGSIAGGAISGLVGQFYGWRWSFILFGSCGLLFAVVVGKFLMEPSRTDAPAHGASNLFYELKTLLASPIVRLLILTFVGANFVAVVFLTWMPSFLYVWQISHEPEHGRIERHHLSAALFGGGRSLGWAAGRLPGSQVGWGPHAYPGIGPLPGHTVSVLHRLGRYCSRCGAGHDCFGYCKGLYDANIFASLYDVVAVRQRGIAAGILNSLGWLGGGDQLHIAIALAANKYGMGPSISGTALVY